MAPQLVDVSENVVEGAVEIVWDASVLVPYADCVDCDARGWPGAGLRTHTAYVTTAASAGPYTARFVVLDEAVSLPTEPRDPATSPNALCAGDREGERVVEVDFELPDSGEVVVDVAIPDLDG